MNQSEFEANSWNRRQARENAYERVTIGFGFASHWLRNWREFCQPIIEGSIKKKQKSTRISFDTQLKTSYLPYERSDKPDVFPLFIFLIKADFTDYLPKGEGNSRRFGAFDISIKQVTEKADYILTVLSITESKVSFCFASFYF